MSTDRDAQTQGELERLRVEVEWFEKQFPCDSCGTPGLNYDGPDEYCSRHGRSPSDLWSMIDRKNEALTRVRELADEWDGMADANEDTHRVAANVMRINAADLRAALDPATPTPSPDSASTGDTGTRAGSAPSEGHSEGERTSCGARFCEAELRYGPHTHSELGIRLTGPKDGA